MQHPREPILNVPAVVVTVLLALIAVHLVRTFVLAPETDRLLLWLFAFVPARYDASLVPAGMPGGFGPKIWTFVTYALIHADWMHLGFNGVWLLAFGSPVARRFGTMRFLAFFAVTVAAGALAHLMAHPGAFAPMIGASAAISGTMGAATRFVFERGGPLDAWPWDPNEASRVPAAPLSQALRNPRVLMFLGVWFGLNLLFGLGSLSLTGDDQSIAWEAHLGGFLAGLILFSAFDRANAQRDFDGAPAAH